jgi:hypothetical protein
MRALPEKMKKELVAAAGLRKRSPALLVGP